MSLVKVPRGFSLQDEPGRTTVTDKRIKGDRYLSPFRLPGGALLCAGRIGSMADRKRRDWLAPVVVVALLLIPLVAYVAGYFTLCNRYLFFSSGPGKIRGYPYHWMASAYAPAGEVEETLTVETVMVLTVEWKSYPANP